MNGCGGISEGFPATRRELRVLPINRTTRSTMVVSDLDVSDLETNKKVESRIHEP